MFFNNKFNTFFGLNLTLVYTFPMCMAWRFHFPIRNYDFKSSVLVMRAIFMHPLGPILWALATPECFPRQISKAVLTHHLQKGAVLAEYIPDKSAIVIDRHEFGTEGWTELRHIWRDCRCYSLHGVQRRIRQFTN